MTLVGFKAQNHRQQTVKRGALEKVDDRRTPRDLWDQLNAEHRFTLDAAASDENTLCDHYYTAENCGLVGPWHGERVWCNPPYSDCRPWVEKAWAETRDCPVIVLLLPANRTEQRWWQIIVEPERDNGGILTTTFLPGRLRFDVPAGTYSDPRGNRPPFGCVLLTWSLA